MPELQIENDPTQSRTIFRLTDAAVSTEAKALAAKLREPFAAGVRKIGEGPGRKLAECEAEIKAFQERAADQVRRGEQAEADLAKALQAKDDKAIAAANHEIEQAERQRRGHNRSVTIWQQLLEETRQGGAQPVAEALESLRQKHLAKLKGEWDARMEAAQATLHQLGVELLGHRSAWEHVAYLANRHSDDILAAHGAQPLGTKPKPAFQEPPPPYSKTVVDAAGHKHVVVGGS